MATTLRLEFQSRHKDTPLLVDSSRRVRFDVWERPSEMKGLLEGAIPRRIREADVGRLDLLAYDAYGDVKLWWVLAAANEYIDPIGDMVPGNVMYIPSYSAVQTFLLRGSVL